MRAFPHPQSNKFAGNEKMIAAYWSDVYSKAFTREKNVFYQVSSNPTFLYHRQNIMYY